jgi:hypothetical protein
VDENAYYSGSLERVNFLEAPHKTKGFVEINLSDDLESENKKGKTDRIYPKPEFYELPTRPMMEIPTIDCSLLDHHVISAEIMKRIESVEPNDKILKIKVQNLPMEVYRALDFNQFRKLTADALHFQIQYEVTREELGAQAAGVKFEVLSTEFNEFFTKEPIEGLDKDRLYELGLEYLISVGEKKEKFVE